MKLLRLAPENTKFGFMRFRRISYPLSAALSIVSVILFLFVGMNFGIDFAGGTQVDIRAKNGEAHIADIRAKAESLGLGPVEVQQIASGSDVLLRLNVQPGGEAGQQTAIAKLREAFSSDYEFRSVDAVGPSVSVRVAIRGRGNHRHDARSPADGRLLLRDPARVQPDLDRGDPHHCGLLAERDRRRARPHPRNDAEI
jgi:preprotein translocase subunit SecF